MEKFDTLKGVLSDPAFAPPTLAAREAVCLFANQVRGELGAASAAEQDRARSELLRIAAAAAGRGGFVCSLANGLLHGLTGEPRFQVEAIRAALAETASDIGVGMNNLFLINRLDFVGAIEAAALAQACDYEARHRYWTGLVERAETVACAASVRRKSAFTPNDRVLILTEQFLQPPHAPSKDALEFGRRFQDAGRNVMIASTCAVGAQLYSTILPGARGSVIESLGGVSGLTFEGRRFDYHQPESGRFNNETVVETLAVIEEFDPAFVLAIGGQNLVAELMTPRSFVVLYPTFAGLPTSKTLNFFLWREPTVEAASLLRRVGLEDRCLFAQHPGFEPPASTERFTRGQFNLPPDAFVFAVVGMRLDLDVGDDFIALMRAIRARRPNAHFLFVGDFTGFAERVGADPALAAGATHIGHQSDVMAAFELCDAYINPTRKGGGSAIVHAITAGLPALSVNIGDAYEAVRELPALKDYAALADAACALAERGETYEAYRAAMRAKAPMLGGKASVMEKLLAAYARFVEARS